MAVLITIYGLAALALLLIILYHILVAIVESYEDIKNGKASILGSILYIIYTIVFILGFYAFVLLL